MDTQKDLNKWKLDLLCNELATLLQDEMACDRYIKQSHVVNKLNTTEVVCYDYKDIRGFDRYVK